jgi:hypothetical protein
MLPFVAWAAAERLMFDWLGNTVPSIGLLIATVGGVPTLMVTGDETVWIPALFFTVALIL